MDVRRPWTILTCSIYLKTSCIILIVATTYYVTSSVLDSNTLAFKSLQLQKTLGFHSLPNDNLPEFETKDPSHPGYHVQAPFEYPAPIDCPPQLRFQEGLPMIALASVPGSGNTWLRHLLQIATGVYTGSIYGDYMIVRRGFEGERYSEGPVLTVKTHNGVSNKTLVTYSSAILLLRDPVETTVAEFHRRLVGHTGVIPKQLLKGNYSEDIDKLLTIWVKYNCDWLLRFPGPVHVVHYRHLQDDLLAELRLLLEFLRWQATPAQLGCVSRNQEGLFHRKKTSKDPAILFTEPQLLTAQRYEQEVSECFSQRQAEGFPLSM